MDENKEKLMAAHEKVCDAINELNRIRHPERTPDFCPWCGIGLWHSDFTDEGGGINHRDVFNYYEPDTEVRHEVVCPHCEKPITMYALHIEYDNVEFEKREA